MSSKSAALADTASLSLNKVVAGPVMLWGLAVSAAIVGDFSGWNTGLLQGGFGGMLVATLIALVLQFFLSMTVAELAAAMPFAGGAAVYARVGFGRWAGLATGTAMLIEYVCAMASIMLIIGHQLNANFSLMTGITVSEPVIWLALIGIFSLLNISGNGTFFRMAVFLTLAPLVALFVYAVSVSKTFSLEHLLDVPAIAGGTDWLPFGLIGIAFAFPFAIWLFLAVDVVTLAAEDTRNPGRDLPKSLIWAMITLAVSSIAVLVVASGTVPGALVIGGAAEPLLLGLQDAFGDRAVLYLFVVLGSAASFHSTIYAGARILFSLSRAGYLFHGLSKSSPQTGIPNRAVIVVAVLTYVIGCATLYLPNDLNIVDILVHMAALGALLSYVSAFCSLVVEGLLCTEGYRQAAGRAALPAMLRPGDLFDDAASLLGTVHRNTVRSRTPALLCEISSAGLHELFNKNPESIERIARDLAEGDSGPVDEEKLANNVRQIRHLFPPSLTIVARR